MLTAPGFPSSWFLCGHSWVFLSHGSSKLLHCIFVLPRCEQSFLLESAPWWSLQMSLEIRLATGTSVLKVLPLLGCGWLLGSWCCPLDSCSLLGAFPIPFIRPDSPRGLAIALLWDVTESRMRRDLNSEVVEGITDGLLTLKPRSLCQPSYGETSPGCALQLPIIFFFSRLLSTLGIYSFKTWAWFTLWSSGWTE